MMLDSQMQSDGPVRLRDAVAADLPAINEIYNHYVLHSTCTYQVEPETPEGRAAWFASHGAEHPVIVAEVDGHVVGWGALSRYHQRCAYGRTVENSVYVLPGLHRRGIGSAILMELIERAKRLGHHTILAVIDAEQAASIALHARFGFAEVGRMKELGFKFGRWLDVVYLQLMM